MIALRTIAVPEDRRVRVSTSTLPIRACISASALEAVAARIDEERVARVAADARHETRNEMLRTTSVVLEEAAARLDAAREQAERALPTEAVALGVEIARQLLKVEIAAENYDLERIVRATLAASEVDRGRCIVHLHPSDAAALESVTFRGETVLRGDPEVPRGSVQVETPRGLLVRDPDSALDEIREQLLEDLA